MVLTNREELATKMDLLRSHGITRAPELMTHATDGPWYYQQVMLGYNYRMTDIQAALGVSQMSRLDDYVTRRHEIARRYDRLLQDMPLILPWQHPDGYSAFHLYVIRLKLDKLERTHRQIYEHLCSAGILVNLHYIPVHTQPYYEELGFKQGDFPRAEQYYREAITLPMYSTLSIGQQEEIVGVLREALEQ